MKLRHVLSTLAIALLPLFAGTQGCSAEADSDPASQSEDVTQMSGYTANFDAVAAIWPGPAVTSLDDMYTVEVMVGDKRIPARTHTFGDVINIIPYSNHDGDADAAGNPFPRGDAQIARVFRPGELGISLKNHRTEYRRLDLNNSEPSELKEHFKLQNTHIQIVVGVEKAEHGQQGAISVNNPQDYEEGRWGDEHYPMIFFRLEYPSYVSDAQQMQYEDNIRTMLIGFNTVSDFPGDYNGGDPLGARDPARVGEHVDNMVRAIAGDPAGQAYFDDPANLVYCAELAYLAINAGIHNPLNAETMVPRVGQEIWDAFEAEINKHNDALDAYAGGGELGAPSAFVADNDNKRVALVRLELARPELKPIAELSNDPAAVGQTLAFPAMTMADILESFFRTHLPREVLGEDLAPAQGALLAAMKPGLLEQMGMDQLPSSDPKRVAVEQLYDALVAVVGTPFSSYQAFRSNLNPLMAKARQVTGPRGDTGEGLFAPPSLFHLAAQDKLHGPAIMKLQYEGHGLHVSATQPTNTPPQPPVSHDDLGSSRSCANSCGIDLGECSCAEECSADGNCCGDYESLCAGPPTPNSCVNACGDNFAECSCDDECGSYGDCCSDYADVCG